MYDQADICPYIIGPWKDNTEGKSIELKLFKKKKTTGQRQSAPAFHKAKKTQSSRPNWSPEGGDCA